MASTVAHKLQFVNCVQAGTEAMDKENESGGFAGIQSPVPATGVAVEAETNQILRTQFFSRVTGGTSETDEGLRIEVRGFRTFEP